MWIRLSTSSVLLTIGGSIIIANATLPASPEKLLKQKYGQMKACRLMPNVSKTQGFFVSLFIKWLLINSN